MNSCLKTVLLQDIKCKVHNMVLYFYHTRPIAEAYSEWNDEKHPGHILYGLTHFSKHSISCRLHRVRIFKSRVRLMFYNLKEILFYKEPYNILYGTSFRGLELIIFLRALGMYRKPIVIWHHTAIVNSPNILRNTISRFFYKGIDLMFFFSTKHINESLQTGKVSINKLKIIHWGADLDFYKKMIVNQSICQGFISTGKENRDFTTLIRAFKQTDKRLDIYTERKSGQLNYEQIINLEIATKEKGNINIHYVGGIIPYELALKVSTSYCVVISCLPYPYTVGLTTLVEALALGKPLIVSNNSYFEVDVEKEGIGLVVDFYDEAGWSKAINYLANNPVLAKEMGLKGRALAEKLYNLENYTKELSVELKQLLKNKILESTL